MTGIKCRNKFYCGLNKMRTKCQLNLFNLFIKLEDGLSSMMFTKMLLVEEPSSFILCKVMKLLKFIH